MQSLTEIKTILAEAGLRPKKSLGQNFLIDANLVRKLIDASGVGPGDLVLEVGPGTGTLTEGLLERGCVVVASELDDALAAMLEDRLGGERCTVVHGDCLAGKRAISPAVLHALGGRPFTLVANLPYHAATPLMLRLMTSHPECGGQFVTVQKEVAERFCAKPGVRSYGSVSVVAGAVCEASMIATLPPTCFWPRPDVTSAMMSLARLENPATEDAEGLADFCQTLFASRRKQLGSVLGRDVSWPEGVNPEDRVEALAAEQIEVLRTKVRESPGTAPS